MSAKRDEFVMWAAEVKQVDVEYLGKFEEKDLFRDFMEDYNTGAYAVRYARAWRTCPASIHHLRQLHT